MSVRARLTLWYATALVVVLVAFAAAVTGLLRHRLYAALEASLAEDKEVVEQLLERRADGTLTLKTYEQVTDHPLAFTLVVQAQDGRVLVTSPRDPAPGWRGSAAPSWQELRTIADGGEPIRVFSAEEVVGDERVVIHVGRSEAPVREQVRELVLVLALLLPIAALIAGAGGHFLARRALSPIAQMAERAQRISAEHLGERLPIVNPRDELGRLAQTFNDTLARLEKSFVHLRQFTADASHELRTPLTALRSVGEVGLRGEGDPAGYREVIGSMLEEADRLTRLVDSLLLLSRSDAGVLPLSSDGIDLSALAREVVGLLGVLAEEQHQTLTLHAEDPILVNGDSALLRQVIVNLVDNAIKFSRRGGGIVITVSSEGDAAICTVRDSGPGIPAEHRERVFERFYRVDGARSRATGGAGLGLAIAKSVATLHNGTLELVASDGRGSVFQLKMSRHGR